MRQEFALAGGVDRRGHRPDPRGAEPEVHPLRARSGEQRDRFAAGDPEIREHVGCRARPVPHLRERDRRPGDRHHHAVAVLLVLPLLQRGFDKIDDFLVFFLAVSFNSEMVHQILYELVYDSQWDQVPLSACHFPRNQFLWQPAQPLRLPSLPASLPVN